MRAYRFWRRDCNIVPDRCIYMVAISNKVSEDFVAVDVQISFHSTVDS